MRSERLLAFDVAAEPNARGWLRWPFGLLLIVHGVIHITGVVLLLGLGEPGDLSYAVARPEPGTPLAVGFAALWALAFGLFLVSGGQLIRGRPWARLMVTASLISLVAVGAMATAAPLGSAVSIATLAIGLWFNLTNRTRGKA